VKQRSAKSAARSGDRRWRETIEPVDLKIVNELLDNGRLSFRQIAAKLGVATATVAQRIQNLEGAGVIRGVKAVLDYEKLGYYFHVMTQVKVRHGRLFAVERRISAMPNVYAVYDHTGGTDATVLARFRDRGGLDRYLKAVQAIADVERTETQLVLNVIKDNISRLPDAV
jgi:Lrp/AsnC family transcriptional regulator, regulator for asnA, asnC and gidA